MKDWLIDTLDKAYIDNDDIDKHLKFLDKFIPFKLLDWEKFIIAIIFGVKTKDEYKDPYFDEFFIQMGRGGGKNGLISALALDLISNIHNVKNYNIALVANTEDQAKVSFKEIYEWIQQNKALKQAIKYNKEEITFRLTNSTIYYVTSNPRSGDGGRLGAVIFDEVHEYENNKLINVHRDSLGKESIGRTFYISSDGFVRGGAIDDLKEKAKKQLTREEETPTFFPFIFKLDDISEVKDEKKWIKAIPRLSHSRSLLRTVRSSYQQAKRTPQRMENFLTKRMNIPYTSPYTTIRTKEEIMATSRLVEVPQGSIAIGAVDFSSLKDFTAVGLIFRVGDDLVLKHHTFIHESVLEVIDFNFPIMDAVEKGLVTIVKKEIYPIIPENMLRDWFIEESKKYRIIKIAADMYRVNALRDAFIEVGLPLETVRSGSVTDSKIYPELSKLFAEKRVVYGDDPMMRWYTNNTMVVNADKKGNKRFEKIDPIRRKNDGFSMFVHAFNFWNELPKEMEFNWEVF